MGRYSSKKRKGTRKQSFKNRKRVKKGGDNHENKDAAQEEAPTTDAPVEDAAAGTDTPVEDAAGDANEAGNEDVVKDWKEGQSEEDIKQAEEEVSNIEGKANAEGELDPDEINKLVNQLAQGEDVPLWAKALAKSGAAGTAAKILNANPKLRDALIEKGIEGIKNADVSMAPGSTGAPGAPNAGTGAPGANTGAAAPGGSYTADDAGYQKFVEAVKTNPGILNEVVYVNDQMSQIFIKKNGNWQKLE